MSTFAYIFIATMVDGLIAFIGAITLFLSKKTIDKFVYTLVAFSAGALFSGAFFHMISESLEILVGSKVFGLVIFGFSLFYLIERFLHWHRYNLANNWA